MHKDHSSLTRPGIAALSTLVLLVALSPLLPASASTARATSVEGSAGVAAIFVRWGGADGLGHIGWAFQSDYDLQTQRNFYWYGSVENPSGRLFVPQGDPQAIGFWGKYGDWSKVINDFQIRGYNQWKYDAASPRHPEHAQQMMKTVARRGYNLFGRNCANAVYDILKAYGESHLPLLQLFPWPNSWFEVLGSTISAAWGRSHPIEDGGSQSPLYYESDLWQSAAR